MLTFSLISCWKRVFGEWRGDALAFGCWSCLHERVGGMNSGSPGEELKTYPWAQYIICWNERERRTRGLSLGVSDPAKSMQTHWLRSQAPTLKARTGFEGHFFDTGLFQHSLMMGQCSPPSSWLKMKIWIHWAYSKAYRILLMQDEKTEKKQVTGGYKHIH